MNKICRIIVGVLLCLLALWTPFVLYEVVDLPAEGLFLARPGGWDFNTDVHWYEWPWFITRMILAVLVLVPGLGLLFFYED